MISPANKPTNSATYDADFTEAHYVELLRLAKSNYEVATYEQIPWNTRFILWRHDLDYSINRAHALAQLEHQEGMRSTYFVNPASEFYNPFEPKQAFLLKEIVGFGHRLGLHFDATAQNLKSDAELASALAMQSAWLEQAVGTKVDAFSFHNPNADSLRFDAESYVGLVNCYSRRLKTAIPYCSDSNGYWRFRRLYDVLSDASDPCLQVLTHPGWWQRAPMPPRQRIFRCAQGRANATLGSYDELLESQGRVNQAGLTSSFQSFEKLQPQLFQLWDYLANSNEYPTLFLECWRLHELQINKLCKALLRKKWRIPAREVNALFEDRNLKIDGWRLFEAVFGTGWKGAAGVSDEVYSQWMNVRNQLVHSRGSSSREQLKEGVLFLCQIIQSLAAWGQNQPICYDGIKHLGSIGIPTYKTADGSVSDRLEEVAEAIDNFPKKHWQQFKTKLQQDQP